MSEHASTPPTSPTDFESETDIVRAIDEILVAVTAVAEGDLQRRVVPRFDDDHPVGAIAHSVNAMVEALVEARETSEGYAKELEEKIGAVERQQLAIQELSTPIIEVWQGVLCVPVVGMLDSVRTSEMTSALLSAIVEMKAECAIVDITGIKAMDTRSVDHFLRMAKAVRLLGARCVLSGVHPDVSQTIVHMGLDLQGVETHRTMSDALRQHVTVRSARRGAVQKREAPPDKAGEGRSSSNAEPIRRNREGRT